MPLVAAETDLPSWTVLIPLIVAGFGLLGTFWALWVNGDRAERQRRRDLHARALEAVLAYREMPFMICRRRHELEERSAERIRIASQFSDVQIELSTCEHLLAADGPDWLSAKYQRLVATARATAGQEAHEAWKDEPITQDSETNMPELLARLEPLSREIDEFRSQISWAGKTRRAKRFKRGGPATEKS